MGYGNRFNDDTVARRHLGSVRDTSTAFQFDREVREGTRQRGTHPDLDITGKVREVCISADHPNPTAIAVVNDVTGSRQDDPKKICAVLPSFLASLHLTGIVSDPQIAWLFQGDAFVDVAPLQVSQFESDERIDADLEKALLEGGGGSYGRESYELAAYYLARRVRLEPFERGGARGYAFFVADEMPYERVDASQVRRIIGEDAGQDVPTKTIFAELHEKWRTFLIVPARDARGASRTTLSSNPVIREWLHYIPAEDVIIMSEPEDSVEVLLGAIALDRGVMDIQRFEASMAERQVPAEVRRRVIPAISHIRSSALAQVEGVF